MQKQAIFHITEPPYAYADEYDKLTLRIRTAKDDIKECTVFFKDKYFQEEPYMREEMRIVTSTELFDYFQCNISTDRNRYKYYFQLTDRDGKKYCYGERGIGKEGYYPYIFPYIAYEDVYRDIEWLKNSIVYQIFPERFCRQGSQNEREDILKWGDHENLQYTSNYGGNLKGIISKIDYLKDLGVNVIYLTPIFKSDTPHKYNTDDYFSIDPSFGTIEDARELVYECHKNGIKIIFDAVFNHCGNNFFAFKDLLKKQENSKYKDWFFIDSYPVTFEEGNYYTFGKKHKNMPKLNTNNKEVREYLLKVGQYWIKEIGIDGWRLDVCDEIGHDFWREFRKSIKCIRQDAVLIGEIMHEAGSFLKGDQLDGIMNYSFKNAVTDFFAKQELRVEQFSNILGENRMLYRDSIVNQMWNLIDSHDTPRFLTESSEKIEVLKLAVVFQFAYVGIPYIYYGDEVGINGGGDPYNRKCMIWDHNKQNIELMDFFKKIIEIRKNNIELVCGAYRELYCKDNVLIFERTYKGRIMIAGINNNEFSVKIDLGYVITGQNLINDEIINDKVITFEPKEGKMIKIS